MAQSAGSGFPAEIPIRSAVQSALSTAHVQPEALPKGRAPYDEQVDVVVVGAGVSGLVAATELAQRGLSVLVLEARDRVGGRTLTKVWHDRPFDLGGQFLGPTQTKALALYAAHGIQTVPTATAGEMILEIGDQRLKMRDGVPTGGPLLEFLAYNNLIKKIDRLAIDVGPVAPWDCKGAAELDAITFAEWVDKQTRSRFAKDALTIGVRSLLGFELGEMSAPFFGFYCAQGGSLTTMLETTGGAQDCWIFGGAQSLSKILAEKLGARVLTGSPVLRIEQSPANVTVHTANGIVAAQRIVLAMPPSLIREIEMLPPVPPMRAELLASATMGSLSKIILLYPSPFWRDQKLNGMCASSGGPVVSTFDETGDYKQGALVGFVAGAPHREWLELDAPSRRAAVLQQMTRYFGPAAAAPLDYIEHLWPREQFSGGAPTNEYGLSGLSRFGATLRAPTGLVHYAGTETAEQWAGYIDGAIDAGQRVALEVHHALA